MGVHMSKAKTIRAIIQARTSSTRFPQKCFAKLWGDDLVLWVGRRTKLAALVDEVCYAIPQQDRGGELDSVLLNDGFEVYYGSEGDVLQRFIGASSDLEPNDYIVRLTADDPFKCPVLIDQCIVTALAEDLDYVSNNSGSHPCPEGLDVEVIRTSVLRSVAEETPSDLALEHVTYDIRQSSAYRKGEIAQLSIAKNWRLTVDYEEDLKKLADSLGYYNARPDTTFFELLKNVVIKGYQPERFESSRARNESLVNQI